MVAPPHELGRLSEVDILRCPACGAPVPLGSGDTTRCAHCATEVPLPDAHRELRRLAQADEEGRRDAEVVFAGLDRPAPLAVKVLAAVLDLPMLSFLLVYGVPFGIVSILVGLRLARAIAARAGLPSGDDMPLWIGTTTIIALVTITTFVPRALGVYANRRLTARARLVSALAARTPAAKGGPSGCRNCGAPLEVATGARVARCLYCGAESAVSIATPLLAAVGAHVRQLGLRVADAATADREERRATLRRLGSEALRYVLTGGVFAGLWAIYAVDADRSRVSGAAPGWGIGALIASTLLLIGLVIASLARSADTKQEAVDRRAGNDVPGWVRVVGPLGVLALIYLTARLGACASLAP